MSKALMFQGTGSSVGKSVLVAGIARALRRRGLKVLPFKPQNMSNNAAVTVDGGEIGRAQALQAIACGVEPSIHMNPVLLKPQSSVGSQIIVQGKIWGQAKAKEYQTLKAKLLPYVQESFNILSSQADLVLIEGAGSASEINLRHHDIANMGFAQAVGAPVILIGDIDRGGVIASLIGTHAVLSVEDLKLVKGFIVNKMRGDASLFSDAMCWIEQKTQWQTIGLLPYFPDLRQLPAEDAADLNGKLHDKEKNKLHISILLLPTISNFDDFDPLQYEPDVQVNFIEVGKPIPQYTDVIILPGSKTTIADLKILYETGWDTDIKAHLRHGGFVMGICGGYQMLGSDISDPHQIEGDQQRIPGLDLLKISTTLDQKKTLSRIKGIITFDQSPCVGYEMHLGVTICHQRYKPLVQFDQNKADGAVSDDGRVLGTYIHGIFHHDDARRSLLRYFGLKNSATQYQKELEFTLDRWADHIESYLNLDLLIKQAM
ncbi:cobyric acid synthase [Commensalibacter oyaizuii]|uniref:Cobyric acid synthase n=1 Tax=Commensalibacter oyaizuii TaxID=3043873 RepID=A0ABT6Q1R7_9PROT|nr:cobyric acid synthase [Commensalibacter sp. TBRC 16381]MDI2090918.1 cobyric acid synthase [Commensalibacter sp. TBRC 16381]